MRERARREPSRSRGALVPPPGNHNITDKTPRRAGLLVIAQTLAPVRLTRYPLHPVPIAHPAGPGGAKGGRGGARAPRAPREFEGEVVGTEGRSGRPRNSDRRKPRDGEGGRRNDRSDRSGRGCVPRRRRIPRTKPPRPNPSRPGPAGPRVSGASPASCAPPRRASGAPPPARFSASAAPRNERPGLARARDPGDRLLSQKFSDRRASKRHFRRPKRKKKNKVASR